MTPATPHQRLERERNALSTRYWDAELQTAARKLALLVEGDDDKTVVERLLARRSRGWATRVHVVVAGSRNRVLDRLETTFSEGFGLVDRDTWTDAEAAARAAALGGRLFVTPGWCLENILFTAPQLAAEPDLDAMLAHNEDPWLRAGALWWTLQRTRDAFNAWQEALGWKRYGALHPDLDFASPEALVASLSTRISLPIRDASGLDLVEVGKRYTARLAELQALPVVERWSQGVHGKAFFRPVLAPWLDGRAGARSAGGWLDARAAGLREVPPPLDTLLAMVLG